MAKTSKMAKSPAKSAKRKVTINDLKAKDAGSVKGGVFLRLTDIRGEADDEKHKNEIDVE